MLLIFVIEIGSEGEEQKYYINLLVYNQVDELALLVDNTKVGQTKCYADSLGYL